MTADRASSSFSSLSKPRVNATLALCLEDRGSSLRLVVRDPNSDDQKKPAQLSSCAGF